MSERRDEELVKLAQEGDSKVMEEILSRYKLYAKSLTHAYYFAGGGDSEDLMQEAMIGIFNAVRDYNGESSFKSFVYLCVKRQLITAVKKRTTLKQKAMLNYIPLIMEGEAAENVDFLINTAVISPEEEIINKERAKELILKIKRSLSVLEYEILQKYLQGYTYVEISEQKGITVKAVDNALHRIRTKLSKIEK